MDDMNSNILGLYDQLAKLSAELKVGETTEEPLGKTNLNTCISGSPESGFNYSIQGSASCPPSLSKARNCLALSQFAHIAPVAAEARHVGIFGAEDQAAASAAEGVSKERSGNLLFTDV